MEFYTRAPVINQLTGQEATISKSKTWFYAKVKNIGKKFQANK